MLHIELEERIQRLEAALQSKVELGNVHHRMQLLESNPSLLSLFRQIEKHPDLYVTTGAESCWPSMDRKASVVLASADSFQQSLDQLKKVSEISVPSIAVSDKLVQQLDPVRELHATFLRQEDEIARLTTRTATLLENWYRLQVAPYNATMASLDQVLKDAARKRARAFHSDN